MARHLRVGARVLVDYAQLIVRNAILLQLNWLSLTQDSSAGFDQDVLGLGIHE